MPDTQHYKEDEIAEAPVHAGGKGFDWLQIAFWTALAAVTLST